MNRISQEAHKRQAVVKMAKKKGKKMAAEQYGVSLSGVKRWCKRYDGDWKSLKEKSHRPHSHPGNTRQRKKNSYKKHSNRNSIAMAGMEPIGKHKKMDTHAAIVGSYMQLNE